MGETDQVEGVIKFLLKHATSPPPKEDVIHQMNLVRTRLFDDSLIGQYPDGVGYGNVSVRHKTGFVISGTGTGGERVLQALHYCTVVEFSIESNYVRSEGGIKPSSESLTHAALYLADKDVNCVLHIHSLCLWKALMTTDHPSTPANAPYGSIEMADSVARIVSDQGNPSGLIVMSGHKEGLIAYGRSPMDAIAQIEIHRSQTKLKVNI